MAKMIFYCDPYIETIFPCLNSKQYHKNVSLTRFCSPILGMKTVSCTQKCMVWSYGNIISCSAQYFSRNIAKQRIGIKFAAPRQM